MNREHDKSIIKVKIKKIDEQINLLSTLWQNLIDKLKSPESIKSLIIESTPVKEFTLEKKSIL